jgi:hypothetical protein
MADARGKSAGPAGGKADERYKWVALANTTAAIFVAVLDGSIVIIALPAIFRGISLDPLSPGNIGYLLWMIMGYCLVQAVLVVNLGRLGDRFGRVRMYNGRPRAERSSPAGNSSRACCPARSTPA